MQREMKQEKLRLFCLIVAVVFALSAFMLLPKTVKADPVKQDPLIFGKNYEQGINYGEYASAYEYPFTISQSGSFAITGSYKTYQSWSSCVTIAVKDSSGKEVFKELFIRDQLFSYQVDLLAGDYSFVIGIAADSTGTHCDVSFLTTFTPSGETVSESYMNPNNDTGTALAYTPGTTVTAQFAANDTVDYYKFTVASKGKMTVTVTPKVANMRYQIVNTKGDFSQTQSSITIGKHTYAYQDVPKGTYYIAFSKGQGTGTYSFSISTPGSTTVSPKKISLKKPVNQAGRKMVVKWAANTKMNGYELQIAKNKGFTSGLKKYTVSSGKTASKTIKNLKKGTTYYVRIRSYVKVSGKKNYSAWSTVKKIKIKK